MTAPPKRMWRRRLAWATGLFVAAWLLASLAAAYWMTRRAKAAYEEKPEGVTWGTIEKVRLTTSDDHSIGGWFVSGREDRPAVLLIHGVGGNRSHCLPAAEMVSAAGCPVLMITARAHGDSDGEVNDFGYSAQHDVVAGVEWLNARRPGKPVVVWGKSLGSAAAAFAAKELGDRVSGYILECPYRDLWTALRNRTRLTFPPVMDYLVYLGMRTVTPLVLGHANKISPMEAIEGVAGRSRVLILAGGSDIRALPEESQDIAERLGDRAKLLVFEGAGHMGLQLANPVMYRAAVLGLLGQVR